MKTIHRRKFVSNTLGAAGALALAGRTRAAKPKKRPNLVIVFPDQMRGQAMGYMGEDPVVTPRLDQFAKESLVLPQAVSNFPVCSPFRAMLMTGKYPTSNGVTANCNSETEFFDCELKESDRCWSDVLKDRGYNLGYIGKWHLDTPRAPYIECKNNVGETKWNEWCPPNRRHGFDYWYSYGTYDYHMNPMYWETEAKRDGFRFIDQWGPAHEADMAIRYISNENGEYRNAEQPFALVVSMNPPHSPYDMFPEKYLKPYEDKTAKDLLVRDNVDLTGETPMSRHALKHTKNYFANITGVDDQFGRILDQLEKSGLAEDTIVLFTSDHGDCLGTHDQQSKNNHFEESMRIPFLIRWPGKIKPRTDSLLISSPDIYPTLLDLMGHRSAVPQDVEGTSHANLFLTDAGARPASQLYMKGGWGKPSDGRRGVRTARYKLMMDYVRNEQQVVVELYDLQKDPYELLNIADENPVMVNTLIHQELIPWLRKTKDPWIMHVAGQ